MDSPLLSIEPVQLPVLAAPLAPFSNLLLESVATEEFLSLVASISSSEDNSLPERPLSVYNVPEGPYQQPSALADPILSFTVTDYVDLTPSPTPTSTQQGISSLATSSPSGENRAGETLMFNHFTISEFVFFVGAVLALVVSSYYAIYFVFIASYKQSFALILSILCLLMSLIEVARTVDMHGRRGIVPFTVDSILADNATAVLSIAACYTLHRFLHAAVVAVSRLGVYAPKLKLKQQRISKLFVYLNVLVYAIINATAAVLFFHPRNYVRSITYWTLFGYFFVVFICLQVALTSLTTALTRCINILTAPPSAGAYAAQVRQQQEQMRLGYDPTKAGAFGFPVQEAYAAEAAEPMHAHAAWPWRVDPSSYAQNAGSYLPITGGAVSAPSSLASSGPALPGSALSIASMHTGTHTSLDGYSATSSRAAPMAGSLPPVTALSITVPRVVTRAEAFPASDAESDTVPHSLVYNNSAMFHRGIAADAPGHAPFADTRAPSHKHTALPAAEPVQTLSPVVTSPSAFLTHIPAPLQPSASDLARSPSTLSSRTGVYKFMLSLLAGEDVDDELFTEPYGDYAHTHPHAQEQPADTQTAPQWSASGVAAAVPATPAPAFALNDRFPHALDSHADLQAPLLAEVDSTTGEVDSRALDLMFDRALAGISVKAVSVSSLSGAELALHATADSTPRGQAEPIRIAAAPPGASSRLPVGAQSSPSLSVGSLTPLSHVSHISADALAAAAHTPQMFATPGVPRPHAVLSAVPGSVHARGGQHTFVRGVTGAEACSVPPTPSIVLTSSLLPAGDLTLSFVPGQPASLVPAASLSHSSAPSAQPGSSPSASLGTLTAVAALPTVLSGPSQLAASLAACATSSEELPGTLPTTAYSAPSSPRADAEYAHTAKSEDGNLSAAPSVCITQTSWPSFAGGEHFHLGAQQGVAYTINSPDAEQRSSLLAQEREQRQTHQFLVVFRTTISKLRLLNWCTSILLVLAMGFLVTNAILNVQSHARYQPHGVWWRDDIMSYVQLGALGMLLGIVRHLWRVARGIKTQTRVAS